MFTRYQKFMIGILAFIQFTVVLDFMVLSPLGVLLMKELQIQPRQFGLVVSAYAFSAGASALLTAGFADKFDRKKLLLFFYTGFVVGTLFCGLANTYTTLLLARVVTGIFGGVISSITYSIVTDLFALQVRGRVMGFVQSAFAASQVLGLPVGLYLANEFQWHAPFLMIVAVSVVVGVLILLYMKPITEHLKVNTQGNAFAHLLKTVQRRSYLRAFAATTLLATGGFMLMPFGSAFSTNNLGVDIKRLPWLYGVAGAASILCGPFIGKWSDRAGKYFVFCIGSLVSMAMVGIYTHLDVTPYGWIMAINAVLMVAISSRMITAMALMTAVPDLSDRGAFMSVNSAVQQISGGIASWVAGLIVVERTGGYLDHYDTLGWVVIGAIGITMALFYRIHRYVSAKAETTQVAAPTEALSGH